MRFHDLRHSCASLLPQTASAPSLFESLFLFCQSKKQALRPAFHFGGELGIRTLGTLRTQHFECCTFDHSDNSPYSILHFLLARIILSNILCFVNKNLRQTEKTVCRRVLIKKAFYKLRYCVYRYFIA